MPTGLILAIKTLELSNSNIGKVDLKKEIDLFRKLKHENIVNYYGTCVTKTHLWVSIENFYLIKFNNNIFFNA